MRDILRTGAKVGFATLAGLLGWVVAGKVLAITLGAAGVGLFGLLRQLLQNLTLVGSLNGQTALVQGIASRSGKPEQIRFSGSVLMILAMLGGTLAIALVVLAPWLGPRLIPHPQSAAFLRWLALAMLVMVAQTYVTGLLNGHALINDLVRSQLLGTVAVVVLIYPMVHFIRGGHSVGYILMLGGPAVLVTFAASRAASREGWMPSRQVLRFHREDWRGFFRMSGVLLCTGIVTTGTQFFMSWLVARRMGLAQAGQFWAAWTLSMAYVTLVLGSLGTYYMPSLSRLSDLEERRELIRSYLRLALVAMPLLVSMVVVFKPWVIRGMLSSSLLPALKVMRWMLIGDLFKGISWVLAFPMLAFARMKWFFWTDVGFSLGLAGASWIWLAQGGGIEGLGALFMLMYVAYLPVMVLYVRWNHGFTFKREETIRLITGIALVLAVSAWSWRMEVVTWGLVGMLAVLGGGFAYLSLRRLDWKALLRRA